MMLLILLLVLIAIVSKTARGLLSGLISLTFGIMLLGLATILF